MKGHCFAKCRYRFDTKHTLCYKSTECIDYAFGTGDPERDSYFCNEAARQGNLNALVHLHEKWSCPMDKDTCKYAAGKWPNGQGNLDCLQYAFCRGFPWSEDTCSAAADSGSLLCLRYAHKNECPWNAETCHAAAYRGDMDCLRYAHENGCPWNEKTCSSAARRGNLECLIYLHENGCPWSETTIEMASLHGEVECLRYAHKEGCHWSEESCALASQGDNLNCLRFLHENGCPWDEDTILRSEGGECMRYAYDNWCPYPSYMVGEIVKKVLFPKWRESVKARQILFYWMQKAQESSCAEGGAGRKRDREEFEEEFL